MNYVGACLQNSCSWKLVNVVAKSLPHGWSTSSKIVYVSRFFKNSFCLCLKTKTATSDPKKIHCLNYAFFEYILITSVDCRSELAFLKERLIFLFFYFYFIYFSKFEDNVKFLLFQFSIKPISLLHIMIKGILGWMNSFPEMNSLTLCLTSLQWHIFAPRMQIYQRIQEKSTEYCVKTCQDYHLILGTPILPIVSSLLSVKRQTNLK